jgi:hypothetical protein
MFKFLNLKQFPWGGVTIFFEHVKEGLWISTIAQENGYGKL